MLQSAATCDNARWAGVWSSTFLQEDLRKLEAFHMHCQRMILGIRWHDLVRNTEVVDRTNLPSVRDVIAKRRNSLFGHVVRPHASPPRIITGRSRLQQELATALVLVGGDSQDARAIYGSSRSAMVHPSAFVLNGLRLVVVATPGRRNGPLLSTRSDDDDDVSQLAVRWPGRAPPATLLTTPGLLQH